MSTLQKAPIDCKTCDHAVEAYSAWLCRYGTQARPVEAMRHKFGVCGPEATKFKVKPRVKTCSQH